jgi:hypothetical protein
VNFLSGGLIPVAPMFKNSAPRIKFAHYNREICITVYYINNRFDSVGAFNRAVAKRAHRTASIARGVTEARRMRLSRMNFSGHAVRSTLIRPHRGDFAGHRAI